jgi:hypothetical protein
VIAGKCVKLHQKVWTTSAIYNIIKPNICSPYRRINKKQRGVSMYEIFIARNIGNLQKKVDWGCEDPIRDKIIKIRFLLLWRLYYAWDEDLCRYVRV